MAIFQQAVGHEPDLSDKNQAFLQEVLIRHGKQMNVVTYLKAHMSTMLQSFIVDKLNFLKLLLWILPLILLNTISRKLSTAI